MSKTEFSQSKSKQTEIGKFEFAPASFPEKSVAGDVIADQGKPLQRVDADGVIEPLLTADLRLTSISRPVEKPGFVKRVGKAAAAGAVGLAVRNIPGLDRVPSSVSNETRNATVEALKNSDMKVSVSIEGSSSERMETVTKDARLVALTTEINKVATSRSPSYDVQYSKEAKGFVFHSGDKKLPLVIHLSDDAFKNPSSKDAENQLGIAFSELNTAKINNDFDFNKAVPAPKVPGAAPKPAAAPIDLTPVPTPPAVTDSLRVTGPGGVGGLMLGGAARPEHAPILQMLQSSDSNYKSIKATAPGATPEQQTIVSIKEPLFKALGYDSLDAANKAGAIVAKVAEDRSKVTFTFAPIAKADADGVVQTKAYPPVTIDAPFADGLVSADAKVRADTAQKFAATLASQINNGFAPPAAPPKVQEAQKVDATKPAPPKAAPKIAPKVVPPVPPKKGNEE